MQQLLLNIQPAARPSLDNFIPGCNLKLISLLRKWQAGETPEKSVYVWGSPGSETHLLRALTWQPAALLWNGLDDIPTEIRLIAPDNIEALGESGQVNAFSAFNHARSAGRLWIAACENAPEGLKVLEELRSRLGWGLVFRLHPLADDGHYRHRPRTPNRQPSTGGRYALYLFWQSTSHCRTRGDKGVYSTPLGIPAREQWAALNIRQKKRG